MAFAKVKLLESTDVEVEELQLNCGKGKGDLEKNDFSINDNDDYNHDHHDQHHDDQHHDDHGA